MTKFLSVSWVPPNRWIPIYHLLAPTAALRHSRTDFGAMVWGAFFSNRRIFPMHPGASLFRECSQKRRTRNPSKRRRMLFALSRPRFEAIFAAQYVEFVFGMWPHEGQPCQKQPSTKIAIFSWGNTKSGLPGIPGWWTFQPLIPFFASPDLSRFSVVLLPLPLTALIA